MCRSKDKITEAGEDGEKVEIELERDNDFEEE